MLELVLVNLCSQRSSVVHMGVDPSCFVGKGHSALEHSFCVIPPPHLPFFPLIYYISLTGALPFCVGSHRSVARICQPME